MTLSVLSVAILVPVLGRPHRVAPLLDSIDAATPSGYSVVFLCDPDDHAEIAAVTDVLSDNVRLILMGGNYATKINHGAELALEPLIFTAADDLAFQPGWLDRAYERVEAGAQVVGVNDTLKRRPGREEHATHFLMPRKYTTLPCLDGTRGPLYEGYDHSWVDDELIATARRRGLYAYADDAVVAHEHWMNGQAPDDETYRKGRIAFGRDRRMFRQRSRLWA